MKQIYALLFIAFLFTLSAPAQDPEKTVQTKKGRLTRLDNLINLPPENESFKAVRFGGKKYLLLQFERIPDKNERDRLTAQGVKLYDYLSGNAFFAELPEQLAPSSLRQYKVGGVYEMDPAFKISPKLNNYTPASDVYVAVNYFGDIDRATVINTLKLVGAKVADTKIKPDNTVFIHANSSTIEKIATFPFVSYISKQSVKDVPLNQNNRGVHAFTSLVNPAGRNLHGTGVVVGVGDQGDPSTHMDFSARLINRNPRPAAQHATHTTGTAGGAGFLDPRFKGMADKITIVSQYYSDIIVNTPLYISEYSMVLTNNSYFVGDEDCPGDGDYDILSNYIDNQSLTYPQLLHVFAAGNDGPLTCLPYPAGMGTIKSGFQTAKNVLTVGNISSVSMVTYGTSSHGPVYDGRLKPEVVAGGDGVQSTRLWHNYGPSWGTSMSAPTVTGGLALIYERYRQLHGTNPPAALLKAAAANSADDWGNAGPDFTYGFGVFNARTTIETIENNQYVLNSVAHTGTVDFTIPGIPAGVHQLKVMLYWPDAPASPSAPNALVNNLDLRVLDPGSTTHLPYILDPTPLNVHNAAVRGIDNLNNIEQVVIDNPAAGNYTVRVAGTNVPSGTQNYVVVYQIINPGIYLEHPRGNEKFVPGENEPIRWNAYGGGNNTFTIEYSTNGGSTWTVINNNVAATARRLSWNSAAAGPTNQARIRVTRNVSGLTDASPDNFTILGRHTTSSSTLAVTNPCPGYIALSWLPIASATSYEVVMYRNDTMTVMGSTTGTSFLITGLSRDSTYYVAVTPSIGGSRGRQCITRYITPNGGLCTLPAFDNDMGADSLAGPSSGREFTSTQLGVENLQIRIRNHDNAATAGSYNISYQVNGGGVVTESSSAVIPALGTAVYSFTQTYDFSALGTYTIKMWVDRTGDTQKANDTLVHVIKHVSNNPVTLSPTFTEGFETTTPATYMKKTVGFDGCDRCDFATDVDSVGRARTFINTGFARSGNRAVTLDRKRFHDTSAADSLTTTFNLSGYSGSDQLWLDFYYRNQGNDVTLPGNQVWIRGSDLGAWIPVFTLPTNDPSHFGVYRKSSPINITETLAAASQTVSSSFQVRFGEQGFTSANSVGTNGSEDDGFTYDDIIITNAQNDVGILALVTPTLTNFCALGANETVEVRVKNYSNVTLNNIAVTYKINGFTVNETIPTLTAGQVLVYQFAQTANLAAFQRYTFDAWVHLAADNYRSNDTLPTIVFNTSPTINTFPYLEGFESSDGYWYTGGIVPSWEWGTPAKPIIDKAANGTKAWVTSLSGTYNNSEHSYLYSPCFDLSGVTLPVFSFSHIFRTEDDCDCDYHWVEYSLDDITWIKLGSTSGGTNWYDDIVTQTWQQSNPLWHVSSYDVPVNPSKIRFRIVMRADNYLNLHGVGVDDIHIFSKSAIYTGADITSGVTQSVSGTNWVHFTSGGRRIASINPNGQNLGNTTVKVYFNNTGNDRYSNVQYYLDRNIVIQPTTAPAGNVSVRFYFTDAEAQNLIGATGCSYCNTIRDPYEAGVTQYSNAIPEENGILGDNLTGLYNFIEPSQVTISPYDNGYYAEYQVLNFSEFWINSGGPAQNRPLPMQLGSFTATKRNSTALLEWVTLQEANTDRFVIEKSYDGSTYAAIGEVKAAGNSSISQRYRFTDPQLMNGINYYRLRLIDINGASNYSPIRLLNINGNETIITVYPNPVKKGVLYINTSENCRRVDISDVTGRILRSVNTQGNRQTIPMHQLSKGTYLITVVTDKGKTVEKVFVE